MAGIPQPAEGPIDVLTIGIDGMSCDNCAASIARQVGEVEGVVDARVSYALEDARIRFHPEHVGASRILEAIADAGFSVRPRGDAGAPAETADPGPARDRLRLTVGLLGSGVVMGLAMGVPRGWLPDFPGRPWWIAAISAGLVFGIGADFHRGAWRAARSRTTNMDTLVSLGASVAFFYSLGVLVLGLDPTRFPVYFESAAMIVTLVLVGKVLERRGKREASGAVRALLDQQPESARVERAEGPEGEITECPIDAIRPNDLVHVRPGERFPVDGVVLRGSGHVDESMLTGESRPVAKRAGEAVHAGTLNGPAAFVVQVRAVGEATVLADIARLVHEAQARRAPIQQSVDRIARLFVPTMIVFAALVGFGWWFAGAERYLPTMDPIAAGILFAASTLLISCPCAMGLATPLALVAGTGVGARRGLLIKGGEALEALASVDTVVLDKTGTLTLGRPRLIDECIAPGEEAQDVLARVAAAERESEHPLARALLEAADELDVARLEASETVAVPGRGLIARVGGQEIVVGHARFVAARGIDVDALPIGALPVDSASIVHAAVDGHVVAAYAIADEPDPGAAPALARLRALGLRTALLSGDAAGPSRAIGAALGIESDDVVAEVLPDGKADHVRARRKAGAQVAMVGDGMNDAPALASADVGIAIGSGTDVAIEAADVVLVRSDLSALAEAVHLSRRTLRTVRQNLFWAFGYNVAAIPLAAGLFVPFGGESLRLSPGIASAAMALSSLFVVTNSARLRFYDPSTD